MHRIKTFTKCFWLVLRHYSNTSLEELKIVEMYQDSQLPCTTKIWTDSLSKWSSTYHIVFSVWPCYNLWKMSIWFMEGRNYLQKIKVKYLHIWYPPFWHEWLYSSFKSRPQLERNSSICKVTIIIKSIPDYKLHNFTW